MLYCIVLDVQAKECNSTNSHCRHHRDNCSSRRRSCVCCSLVLFQSIIFKLESLIHDILVNNVFNQYTVDYLYDDQFDHPSDDKLDFDQHFHNHHD